eukprot:2876953-Amphidinium_carterae.1
MISVATVVGEGFGTGEASFGKFFIRQKAVTGSSLRAMRRSMAYSMTLVCLSTLSAIRLASATSWPIDPSAVTPVVSWM